MRCAARRRRGSRSRAEAIENPLHVVGIASPGVLVPFRRGRIPDHDSTEHLRILVNIRGNQRNNLCRRHVVHGAYGRSLIAGQANKKFGRRVGAVPDDIGPSVVVEAGAQDVDEVISATFRVVVELRPDEVKRGIGDGVAELLVGQAAPGSSREVELLIWLLGEVSAQFICNDSIAYRLGLERRQEEVAKDGTYQSRHCTQCQSRSHRW